MRGCGLQFLSSRGPPPVLMISKSHMSPILAPTAFFWTGRKTSLASTSTIGASGARCYYKLTMVGFNDTAQACGSIGRSCMILIANKIAHIDLSLQLHKWGCNADNTKVIRASKSDKHSRLTRTCMCVCSSCFDQMVTESH